MFVFSKDGKRVRRGPNSGKLAVAVRALVSHLPALRLMLVKLQELAVAAEPQASDIAAGINTSLSMSQTFAFVPASLHFPYS